MDNLTPDMFVEWQPPMPYNFNDRVAEMVGPELAEEYQRTLRVWQTNGWTCRDEVVKAFDKEANYKAIRSLGKKRALLMAELMRLPYGQDIDGSPSFNFFTAVTGLPVDCGPTHWINRLEDKPEGHEIGDALPGPVEG